ncbi:Zinc transporter ZupT [Maioricimonas rarisocia]|uniref:Zinc transporter ZupT n=1 Tax=Maioricimonas rarisocia TaxID=2528026 RepID=A0A517ZDH4_9PLAN|nr:ZIP family metal transporter [Maioricimonas rarisocia]QDU40527.1 Zinc transporter ZupT [Maioricimonas rarisocia]
MPVWFADLNPVLQALLAGLFTWSVTALGAASVFFGRKFNQKLLDWMLGFAGGVMMAASYWSLLAPSIEIAENRDMAPWWPAAAGLIAGVFTLWALDKVLPHLHPGMPTDQTEGPESTWHRSVLLVTAITLHNIPEGLAVGVAFGGVISGVPSASLAAAVALALGIGLQNFPEGIAVAMPLRGEGMSRGKAFWFGQLSAIVEPVAAVLGAAAVTYAAPMLPYALSFAAGAMIFVVVEELIPESQQAGNVDLATVAFVVGFTVMMILDVALG